MKKREKNINLYLLDGIPAGRIKCTLANWIGVAYRIPRTDLDLYRDRKDLRQCGVYFLFATAEQTGEDVVYIGQAGIRKSGVGILNRLQEHRSNPDKDYWTEAVVLTTSNNSFGPTEISYLENRFCAIATETNRYTVKNGNEPNPGNITEEKESELEEFIDYARIVMGALGHKVFEPLIVRQPDVQLEIDVYSSSNEQLHLIQGDTHGYGQRTGEGFVLQKGSRVRKELLGSCSNNVRRERELYAGKINEDGVLQEDILLRSPNEAAGFTVGSSINAREAWKDVHGRTLNELEANK